METVLVRAVRVAATTAEPSRLLQVGTLGRVHGLQGEIFLRPISDRAERFQVGSELYDAAETVFVIETSRAHDRGYLVRLRGVETREAATPLVGVPLYAYEIDDPEVWMVHQLIECSVVEENGTARGFVRSVQANPAHDLLVTSEGALIPVVFITKFDRSARVVTVAVPDGLFELE
ncbi:MAG: ribosome maturation factor RimM [Ferrimicrobium sp.]